MACSIEMLPCERCGREVERYNIYVRKNEEGQREFVCPICAGEETEPEPAPAQPDCA